MRARSDAAAILFFLLLAVLFFAPVLFGGATLLPFDNLYRFPPWSAFAIPHGVTQAHNPLLDDLILENYAWKYFIVQSLRAGELPLWNPYIFAGQPFLAAGQNATLYPPGIVFYLLPLTRAYAVFAVLHYWLAACAMYLLARVLGLRPWSAAVSAVVYAFGGFMVVSVVFPMIVSAATWLPAILACIELALCDLAPDPLPKPNGGRMGWFLALGAAILIGLQFLAGHIEISYYILLVVAFYAAWRILGLNVQLDARKVNVRGLLRASALVVGIVLCGAALAAIQIVPLYELVTLNFRAGSVTFDDVVGWALPTRQLVTFFLPDFFGNPTHHAYFDLYTLTWKPAPQGTIFWGVKNYVEAGAYVGILAMALAALAVVSSVRLQVTSRKLYKELTLSLQLSTFNRQPSTVNLPPSSVIWFFMTLATVSLLFAFGTPLYALLYYGLPGWNQLHTPFRWLFPWTLSMAFLAGVGAQYLRGGAGRLAQILGVLLAPIGLATFIGVALSLLVREPFLFLADAFVNTSDLAKPVFETGQAFWSYQARNLALFGLLTLAAGMVFLVARRNWRVRNISLWQPLALVLIVADLFVVGMGFYPRADVKLAEFVPPAIQFLQQDRSLYRITSYDRPGEKVLNANAGMPFGLFDVRGYDSIILKQYVEFMRALAPQDELLYNRIAAFYDYAPLGSRLLDLLNVKYVLTTRAVPNPNYELVYDGEIKIYENKDVLPRAFLVTQARGFETREELLRALPTLDPTREVWLETSPPASLPEGEGSATSSPASLLKGEIVKYSGNEVIVKTSSPQPAYLVLADSYLPGWIAQIDGQDTPIYRANGNFRAVWVPAGEHNVRFKYSPLSFRVGAVISLLAAIAVLLAGVGLAWRQFVLKPGGDSESSVRTVAKNSLVPMGASFVIQLINFALALVVLRVLGPENNGRYAFAVTVWFFLSALTEFGLSILVMREVARDRAQANRYLTGAIVLRLALTALSFVPLLGFIYLYTVLSNLTPDTIAAILLLWVSLFPNNLAGALSVMFNAFERFEYPTAVEICTALVSVALQIAVLLAGYGIIGLAAVSIITNLFTLTVLYYLVRRLLFKPQFTFERHLARWMFFESYPLMMNNLLANLFFKIDVFLLQPLAGDLALGYYNAAYKFVNALNFIPSKFTLAVFPVLSRYSTDSREVMRRALILSVKLLIWIAVPITVATVFLAPQLIRLFAGAAYLPDSAIALRWLIWFLPFSFVNSIVHYVLIALNEQRFLTKAFLIGLGFNLAANWLAIPPLSYRGAALVTVLSELALFIPFYYALRKHLDALPILDLFWRPAVAGAAMAACLFWLLPYQIVLALVIGSVAYGLALLLTGAWGVEEWALAQRLVPKRFERVLVTLARGSVAAAKK